LVNVVKGRRDELASRFGCKSTEGMTATGGVVHHCSLGHVLGMELSIPSVWENLQREWVKSDEKSELYHGNLWKQLMQTFGKNHGINLTLTFIMPCRSFSQWPS
jgi:hypothetical protein